MHNVYPSNRLYIGIDADFPCFWYRNMEVSPRRTNSRYYLCLLSMLQLEAEALRRISKT